jgi:DNA polymerase-3 subunit alpha
MDYLWIDVETTGRFADKHDVIQLACIPVVRGVKQKPFNEFCRPKNWNSIEQEAINVHGISIAKMKTFQSQEELLDKLVDYLSQFKTRFVISGFNVNFDKQFTSWLFNKNDRSQDFFSLFDINIHDTFARAKSVKGQIKTENMKLETLAKHWGIEINAHDGLSDISATIEVDKRVGELLKEDEAVFEHREEIDAPEFKEMAHLHLHSMYDMTESIPEPKDWTEWCKSIESPGYAIVDHCSAISMSIVNKLNKDKNNPRGIPGTGLLVEILGDLCDVNAWAVTNDGYFNVNYLASVGYDGVKEIDGVNRSRVSVRDIKKYQKGVRFGVGHAGGFLGKAFIKHGPDYVNQCLLKLHEALGDKLYIELSCVDILYTYSKKLGFQSIPKSDHIPDSNLTRSLNHVLMDFAEANGVKMLATTGASFIPKSDKLLQDIMAKNSYDSGKCYHESYHAHTTRDSYVALKHLMKDRIDVNKFEQMIDNSLHILSESSNLDVSFEYHLPKVTIPDYIKNKTDDYDKQTYYLLIEKCKKHGRWKDDPIYIERFKKEIDVIMKNKELNFIPYFLFYEDISTYARSKGIVQGLGRGSAGGCLMSYYLKIIHIDPIEADLPFERFLSHARINGGSFPDIDSDFGDRTEIIKYIHRNYGDGFAQICTFLTMKTKGAIKDAMWALYGKNRKDPAVEAICNLIPDSPQGVDETSFIYGFTNKEGEYTPGLIDQNEEIANFFKQFSQVEAMVKRLIKLVRGWGRHPSAFVVSTLNLPQDRIPTMKMYDDHIGDYINVTQLEAPMVEDHGLVKADILGVTTIQMVSECMDLIKERHGRDMRSEDDNGIEEIYRLPEDPTVYRDFYNKKTDSSFQFNTTLIKMFIKQFAPQKKEDLAVMTAICRPGALDAPFFDTTAAQFYFDVRSGKRDMQFVHSDLEPIVSSTNGIFAYQEQIMKFLVDIVGYTLEESDQIRGAIAKKKKEKMMAAFDRIREATKKRGWTEEQTETICAQVLAFSRYSFNRSHSRCYGDTGYITMYLKHHYPLEWWTSVLNNVNRRSGKDSEEKLRFFMHLVGDLVQPPSLAKPSGSFEIVGDKIVAPLSVLKKVGGKAVAELVRAGPFENLDDYIESVAHNKVNIGVFTALVKGRATDCFIDKENYSASRQQMLQSYVEKRKTKDFTEDVYNSSPLSVFLMERETNKCFNKSLLNDPRIIDLVMSKSDKFDLTNSKAVPLIYKRKCPVISSVRVAELLQKEDHGKMMSMLLLFQESSHHSGISKKTGKKYERVRLVGSDGYSDIEFTLWNVPKALGWKKNSLFVVRGELIEGFRSAVSMKVESLEQIEI